MSILIVRNPYGQGPSNTATPVPAATTALPQYKYYKQTYVGTGTKENIYLPDTSEIGVYMAPTGGSAQVEFTFDPPDVVEAGTAAWIIGTPGAGTTPAYATILGPTAIRINATAATSTILSVRA